MKTIWDILKENWATHPRSVLTIAIISAYLVGHTVKVFSKIVYDFFEMIFDENLNKWSVGIFEWAKKRLFSAKVRQSPFYSWLKKAFKPFRIVIGNIFVFKGQNYFRKEDVLTANSLDELDARVGISFPRNDIEFTKLSGVITNQESLRTLGTFFLAKYNLYRSLSLIFLFTTVYYWCFIKMANAFLKSEPREISGILVAVPVILWFTFHVKFKRYWRLYGQERQMSLFYFLNKEKINAG